MHLEEILQDPPFYDMYDGVKPILSDYYFYVNAETRMRIAIDLVLHPCNQLEGEVTQKAFTNWNLVKI